MNEITPKRYACARCGHVVTQSTNHYGQTYGLGRFNTCPMCPPWAKYPEFGGSQTWNCLDSPADVEKAERDAEYDSRDANQD